MEPRPFSRGEFMPLVISKTALVLQWSRGLPAAERAAGRTANVPYHFRRSPRAPKVLTIRGAARTLSPKQTVGKTLRILGRERLLGRARHITSRIPARPLQTVPDRNGSQIQRRLDRSAVR